MSIFVTGTNTNIGKTFISAMLMSVAISHGLNAQYFKPIQTGDDCDCTTVKNLTTLSDAYIVKPIFSFTLPATPYLAALAENQHIDISKITDCFIKTKNCSLIVEGAGGLLVPITQNLLMRDLIQALNIPLLIVASTQLGTMNHTLLTIEAALRANIPIKGIVLSGAPYPNLVKTLQLFTDVPILAEIPWLNNLSAENFKKNASFYFNKTLLQKIFDEHH